MLLNVIEALMYIKKDEITAGHETTYKSYSNKRWLPKRVSYLASYWLLQPEKRTQEQMADTKTLENPLNPGTGEGKM